MGGRFSRAQRPPLVLAPELVFEKAPLAAEFRLAGCAARNALGIVARQRDLADFKTLHQVAQQRDPRRDQVAGLGWDCVHSQAKSSIWCAGFSVLSSSTSTAGFAGAAGRRRRGGGSYSPPCFSITRKAGSRGVVTSGSTDYPAN